MITTIKKNTIILSLQEELYPLEVIYGACYVFLDKVYIFLERDQNNRIVIYLTGKKKLSSKDLKNLAGEFYNELINYNLRYQISVRNQKLREYILGRTLVGSLFGRKVPNISLEEESEKINDEPVPEEIQDWGDDALGISIPWEEKFKPESDKDSKIKIKDKTKRNNKK